MQENFNVANPTKENIDFAFKNLIYYVTASTKLDIYKEQKKKFEKVNLISISDEQLQNIKFDLIDLDTETKFLSSYFAEWSLLWIDAIISLRMSEIKIGGIDNGR